MPVGFLLGFYLPHWIRVIGSGVGDAQICTSNVYVETNTGIH